MVDDCVVLLVGAFVVVVDDDELASVEVALAVVAGDELETDEAVEASSTDESSPLKVTDLPSQACASCSR